MTGPAAVVPVVAAVIEERGRLLVTRRPAGVHLEGYWEFPGGKVAVAETREQSLVREIAEELDCLVDVGPEVFTTEHAYADRTVRLHFFRCRLRGTPRPMMGQELRWVSPGELKTLKFPPADEAFIEYLVHPRS